MYSELLNGSYICCHYWTPYISILQNVHQNPEGGDVTPLHLFREQNILSVTGKKETFCSR